MFTRHLYEADEVAAALHWSIAKGRTKEALFWCLELLQSELKEMLREELYSIWLWSFGIGSLASLHTLSSTETDEQFLELVSGMSRLPKESRDRSIFVLLHLCTELQQPDRASFFPSLQPLFERLQCTDFEQAFLSAVYQGKTRLAFDLSRSLWQENAIRVFDLLQQLQKVKQNEDLLAQSLTLLEFYSTMSWPIRLCAIAAVCLDKKRLKQSFKPLLVELLPDQVCELEEWKSLTGRRGRRIFPIPRDCLYKKAARGYMSNKLSNLSTLYTINPTTLEGCPFWDRVIEEEAPWLDDDRLEEFYDTYFPDDIPDEWSRADQEKSHGFGVLINEEVANNQKFFDRWYLHSSSRAYWLPNREVRRYLKEEEWDTLYEKPWNEIVSTWCVTPVKKRVLVVEDH